MDQIQIHQGATPILIITISFTRIMRLNCVRIVVCKKHTKEQKHRDVPSLLTLVRLNTIYLVKSTCSPASIHQVKLHVLQKHRIQKEICFLHDRTPKVNRFTPISKRRQIRQNEVQYERKLQKKSMVDRGLEILFQECIGNNMIFNLNRIKNEDQSKFHLTNRFNEVKYKHPGAGY